MFLNRTKRAIRGWRCVRTMPPPPAPAGTHHQDQWAQHVPTEHDEEKGKERGCHWLWEGARSSRAAPRERAIHSGRLTGQCTSRHPTSLLTDGHGTAAVNRTSPPHSRRETEVPPGGSNGFAPACGCRRGGGFFRGPARSRPKFTRLEFGTTSSRDGRDCQVEFKKEQSGTKKRPLETRTCRESCSLKPPDG